MQNSNSRKSLVLAAALFSATAALATDYTFIVLTNAPGHPAGINDSNQIVGSFGGSHGFIYTLSSMTWTQFDVPAASSTWLNGINNKGEMAGKFVDMLMGGIYAYANGYGYQYTTGGYYDNVANGINNQETVVGHAHWTWYPDNADGACVAANCPTGSAMSMWGYHIFGCEAWGNSINDNGTVAGSYVDGSGHNHGFRCSASGVDPVTLDYPDKSHTFPTGINNFGTMVGYYYTSYGSYDGNGFVYDGTSWVTVNYPGAVKTFITGINNRGNLVGWFVANDFNGTQYSFVAFPSQALTLTPIGGGQLTVTWSGTLLETTNLASGIWTTNTHASPYTFTPSGQQKFFRTIQP